MPAAITCVWLPLRFQIRDKIKESWRTNVHRDWRLNMFWWCPRYCCWIWTDLKLNSGQTVYSFETAHITSTVTHWFYLWILRNPLDKGFYNTAQLNHWDRAAATHDSGGSSLVLKSDLLCRSSSASLDQNWSDKVVLGTVCPLLGNRSGVRASGLLYSPCSPLVPPC